MCNCIDLSNEALEAHNLRLDLALSLSGKAVKTLVSTSKIDPKKRGRPGYVAATHCPFCGEKYVDPGEESIPAQPSGKEVQLQEALSKLLNTCIGWLRQWGYNPLTIDRFSEIREAKQAIADADRGLRYLTVVQKARTIRTAANSPEGIHPDMMAELFGAVDALDGKATS